MTTIRPSSAGSDPSTRPPATTRPHTAIGTGFSTTAWTEVATAVKSPTSRSSSIGNETTLITSTSTAKRNPTPTPTTISAQPAPVVNTSREKAVSETIPSWPRIALRDPLQDVPFTELAAYGEGYVLERITQGDPGPGGDRLAHGLLPRRVHDRRRLGAHRRRRGRGVPLRRAGAGDQRGLVPDAARPGRRALHGGGDLGPRRGGEPGADGRVGPDRGGRPAARVAARASRPDRRHAGAGPRHLAPLPQAGAALTRARPPAR